MVTPYRLNNIFLKQVNIAIKTTARATTIVQIDVMSLEHSLFTCCAGIIVHLGIFLHLLFSTVGVEAGKREEGDSEQIIQLKRVRWGFFLNVRALMVVNLSLFFQQMNQSSTEQSD